jgi:hypothetical protein
MTGKYSRVNTPSAEIGGYFCLDLPDYGDTFPNTLRFQSGRAALRALLESAGIKRVMLPVYICNAVTQAVIDSGAVIENYFLDDSLYPKDLPDQPLDNHALLYVNYFGLCQKNIVRLNEVFPNKHLIVDNSHALFSQPTDELAAIYSPRKFIGVPDGGLLVTSCLAIKEPEYEDTESIGRMRHLLLRMAYTAQDGYPDFLEAESSLGNTRPLRMSRLTKRILASINMETVRRRRRDNFLTLASRLNKYNQLKWELDSDSVPLCYPLVMDVEVEAPKKELARKGIYIPTYWPEVKQRVQPGGIEHRLTNCCLAVPCDHRYSPVQMSRLADEIDTVLDSE